MEVAFNVNSPFSYFCNFSFRAFEVLELKKVVVVLNDSRYLVFDEKEYQCFNVLAKQPNVTLGEALGFFSTESEKFNFLHQIAGVIKQDSTISTANWNRLIVAVKFDLTYGCNLTCSHCFQAGDGFYTKQTNLDTDKAIEFLRSISSSRQSEDKIDVMLTGGEVLLHEKIYQFLLALNDLKFIGRIYLLTNGVLSEKLKDCLDFVSDVQLSIDGFSKEAHENRRGQGTFERVIESMKRVKQYGKGLSINITVGKDNIENIKTELFDFIDENDLMGKSEFIFTRMMPLGLALTNELSINDTDFASLMNDLLTIYGQRYSKPKGFQFVNRMANNCNIGQHVNVSVDGGIWLCGFVGKYLLGNINSFNQSEYFDSITSYYKKTSVDNVLECRSCELRFHCKGGCKIFRGEKYCNVGKKQAVLIDMCTNRFPEFNDEVQKGRGLNPSPVAAKTCIMCLLQLQNAGASPWIGIA